MPIPIMPLGQAGFRIIFGDATVYIDPYLSHSVEELDGPDLVRRVPVWKAPEQISDADWVLVTHMHLDHCDPKTLGPIAMASPESKFLCPGDVKPALLSYGIAEERIVLAVEEWLELAPDLKVHPVPACHPSIERDRDGLSKCVGYVLDHKGRRFYHGGDTSPAQELLEILIELAPEVAFLPVNERNFFRDRRGIIGNMSVREAFLMAQEIGAKDLVAMHWDMFTPNSVYPEELELLYRLMEPPFRLHLNPKVI